MDIEGSDEDKLKSRWCRICEKNFPIACQLPAALVICPECGNYFERSEAERRNLIQWCCRQNLTLVDTEISRPTDTKTSSDIKEASCRDHRMSSLGNFFQNVTSRRRRSAGTSHGSSARTSRASLLPPIEKDGGRMTTSPRPSESRKNVHRVARAEKLSPRSSTSDSETGSRSFPEGLRDVTAAQLKSDLQAAAASGDWDKMSNFYQGSFKSIESINFVFKRDPQKPYQSADDPGLRMDLLEQSLDCIRSTKTEIRKNILKNIIDNLLSDKSGFRHQDTGGNHSLVRGPRSHDEIRFFMILLFNPQFESSSTYVILAHLLRQVAAMTDHDHHFLVHWMRPMGTKRVRSLVANLQNFISVRLFPPKPDLLPPIHKCTWWIPNAVKVLALINAASNLSAESPLVPFSDFYNHSLDHLDLAAEYQAWQSVRNSASFNFCQYAFVLSANAKKNLLQKDSEQQMIVMARKSLVAKVQRRQVPDIGMLFLNLTVRRSHLVPDSLHEIARNKQDLKKKLKVTFAGEPGLDMGGLTKEWFLLLIRKIFKEEYGASDLDICMNEYIE